MPIASRWLSRNRRMTRDRPLKPPGGARWIRHLGRLALLTMLSMAGASAAPPGPAASEPFGFDEVIAKAKQLAQTPYTPPRPSLPHFLVAREKGGGLSYDQYRDIRFRPDRALWREEGLPFQVQLFHLGLYFDYPVALNIVDRGVTTVLPFSADLFDYGKNPFIEQIPRELGFAGFRIHAPINRPDYYDEIAVFLGASYFRAVGRQQHYGLSARGLAVDTALSSGEEFPAFREFWLVKPELGATEFTVYALLDSPSVAGAYEFIVRPGERTIIDVKSELFTRERIEKLGLAPLTSMFLYGENGPREFVDFRPEVHDSDGLMMQDGSGEWLWRTLQNPHALLVNGFALTNPRGFGLVQRDRNFDHFQDLETRYDARPSVWIAPVGDWGKGRVELIQIPSKEEIHDNIATLWVPEAPIEAGQALKFAYRTEWYLEDPLRPPGGRTVATRLVPMPGNANVMKVVLDFEGAGLTPLGVDAQVEGLIDVTGGIILEKQVSKNEITNGWRLVFLVQRENGKPVELRAFLKHQADVLTETWSYALPI